MSNPIRPNNKSKTGNPKNITDHEVSTNECTSLDEDEKEPMFHFRSENSNVVFAIPVSAVKLSEFFDNVLAHNEADASTPETALVIGLVPHADETLPNVYFNINTERLLRYCYDYFMLWYKNTDDANYIKAEPVQTWDPAQLLKEQDLSLIRRYLHESIECIKDKQLPGYDNFSMETFITDIEYNHEITIKLLNELLTQVTGFLLIESFGNKIFAYLATIIWDTSLVDIGTSHGSTYFTPLNDAFQSGGQLPDTLTNATANTSASNSSNIHPVLLASNRYLEDSSDLD